MVKIHLEDNGQDFLTFTCDDAGVIIKAEPYQSNIWEGGVIPVSSPEMISVGKLCPMHKPPTYVFGFLNHKIAKVELI